MLHSTKRLRLVKSFSLRNASTSAIYLESDGTSNFFKIALPVKKEGKTEKTAFVVSGTETVSDLLSSIQREHLNKTGDTYFLDNEGVRISGATSISSLLLTNFKFILNQETHSVESRINAQDGAILTPVQLNTITELLNSQKEDTLPLPSFLELTKKAGIENSSAIQALRYLSRSGKYLYFAKDKELKDIIFLNPASLAGRIEKSLLNDQFRLPLREKIIAVEALKRKLIELESVRQDCIARSDRNAHFIATIGFVFISAQFLLFARLTWWDSDWDVMEPITWFVQANEMVVAAFAYYLFKGSEFGHLGFREGLLAWQLKKQYSKYGFSEEAYQNLSCEIAELETQISLIQSRPYNHMKE